METSDCNEKLLQKQIQPLKEANTVMVECPPSDPKVETIKTTKGHPTATIKFQVLKTHIEQGVGKDRNHKMYLKVDGSEQLLADKSKIKIWERSHIIVRICTKFIAVCRDPELKKEFDLEQTTSLSKIKDDILVELSARSLEVTIGLNQITMLQRVFILKQNFKLNLQTINNFSSLSVLAHLKISIS
jgi:heme-binding NEAT domain protein